MTVVLVIVGVFAAVLALGWWCGQILRRDIAELRRWSGDSAECSCDTYTGSERTAAGVKVCERCGKPL